MKALTFLILMIHVLVGTAQFQTTDKLIRGLNNDQFIIDHNHKAGFTMKSKEAQKLIQKGVSATPKLVQALENPEKIIMAHLVLSHIYYKQVTFAGPKVHSGDMQDVYKYFLGGQDGKGIIISEIKQKGKYKMFVEKADAEEIITYWKNKIAAK